MNKRFIGVIAVLFLIKGCVTESEKSEQRDIITYHLDGLPDEPADMKLSELFTAVEIIPLETRQECLTSASTRVIQAGDSYLVSTGSVGQPGEVYRFDSDGKFLNELGSPGRGPDEHLGGMAPYMQYFPEEETVLVNWGGGMGTSDYPQLQKAEECWIQYMCCV